MIEIIVAYDTSLNIGLIVVGTGHALVLQGLREIKKRLLMVKSVNGIKNKFYIKL